MKLNPNDVQLVLSKAGYYNGAIDGIIGPKSKDGILQVLENHPELLEFRPDNFVTSRNQVGAVQLVLHFAEFEPGVIDGLYGVNTSNALMEWKHSILVGKKLELDRKRTRSDSVRSNFPSQSQMDDFYGQPGKDVESQLTTIRVPYQLVIEWRPSQTVDRITLHRHCADQAIGAMEEIQKFYGLKEIDALGLNLYSGAYNHRRMRGGSQWSTHAYGAAIDWYASENGLTTRCPKAAFCRPDYEPFLDIWEQYGFVSLGREIGRDFMHVQAATL